MLRIENHFFRTKLYNQISEKALFRINKKGSGSTSKLQWFNFASRAERNLLLSLYKSVVVDAQLRTDSLTSFSSLSRGLLDVLVSAFGQKPSPWLPFETKSLALGTVKLLVGINKEPILSVDVLNFTSFQPDKCPWEQADTKVVQLHSSLISLHRWILLRVLLLYLDVHLLFTAHLLWNHTSLDGAGGPWCLILST